MGLQFKKNLGYKKFIYRGQEVVIDEVKDDEEFKAELFAHDATLFEQEAEEKPKKRGPKNKKPESEPAETDAGAQVPMVDHVVTADDLAKNPELVAEGIKEGDTIQIPAPEAEQ